LATVRPISFAQHYGLKPLDLMRSNAFDPLLNADTALFIDPMLLPLSRSKEVADQAADLFQNHFSTVFRLLSVSKKPQDASWKAARRLLDYNEVPYTCLGYGTSSIRGSSMSAEKKENILSIAHQISEIGLIDPFLLPLLSLLERGIGPDHISDMVTAIIHPALADFTKNVCSKHSVPTEQFNLFGKVYDLPVNPTQHEVRTPVLLAPLDVLMHLPIATSWNDVYDIAAANEDLRQKVNTRIGEIFRNAALSEEEKKRARAAIFGSKEALELIVEALKSKSLNPYDFNSDPHGFLLLQQIADSLPSKVPLAASKRELNTPKKVVGAILDQYKLLVERHGYWKEFWSGERFKNESVAQRLFYLVAFSYCQANNLDASPEVDLTSGRIDFKFSRGARQKVIVEVKKSSNSHLLGGIRSQLLEYCIAEGATNGVYLVVDHGEKEDAWLPQLIQSANDIRKETKIDLEIFVVDAHKKAPPSKGGGRIKRTAKRAK